MKHLFITGGCGFIGSKFIKRFLRTHPDWKITNLDKLTYCGNRENTRTLEATDRYRFVEGDITDPSLVDSLMKGADGAVHFAAETHVDRSIDHANDFLLTNILGTRCVVEAARIHRIPRFIQISTDEVYGSIHAGAAKEDAPLLPSSPYSASKAAGDLLIHSYWKTYQYPAVIVRSTNNFGPYQFPEKVIPLFITNLLEGKKVPLYGSGRNRRDWIYVDDNCEAIELVFDKGEGGTIYNVGAGNETSNLDLTVALLKAMGQSEDRIEYAEDRPGHDFRYAVNTDKIRKLGFKPRHRFEDALRETIRWYQSHEGWWRPLKKDKFTVK